MRNFIFRSAAVVLMLTLSANADELHEAASNGDAASVSRILSSGADTEALDDAELTPLVLAALDGHIDVVKTLIDGGADARGRDGKGFTALHAAAHGGHAELVKHLLDLGLDVGDRQNAFWITPLHAAAERNFLEIAKMLIDAGSDLEATSRTGHTPVFMAALNAHADMVILLREAGADCDHIRSARYRAYCHAIER